MSEFHSLLEAEIPRLRRYARALVRDRDRADDLVQDTLMRALAKQHLWEPGTNLRAWLFTLMHNQHVNSVRRPAREPVQLDAEEMSGSLIATTDPTASCQLRELENALARLRPEEREIICSSVWKACATTTPRKFSGFPSGRFGHACSAAARHCASSSTWIRNRARRPQSCPKHPRARPKASPENSRGNDAQANQRISRDSDH